MRTATRAGVAADQFELLTGSAFCEGWSIYKSYGSFPASAEWYDIAATRIQAIAFPTPALVAQVATVVEAWERAYETGDVTGAELDLYCGLR